TLKPSRGLPNELVDSFVGTHPKGGFDPGGQGMEAELLVPIGRTWVRRNDGAECLDHFVVLEINLRGGTLQLFADVLRGIEWNTKDRLSNLCYFALLLQRRAAARHRG